MVNKLAKELFIWREGGEEANPEPCQTFKVEFYAKIVNSRYTTEHFVINRGSSSPLFDKRAVLETCGVLFSKFAGPGIKLGINP